MPLKPISWADEADDYDTREARFYQLLTEYAAEIERLTNECFALAAHACTETPHVYLDEGGHPTCPLVTELNTVRELLRAVYNDEGYDACVVLKEIRKLETP